MRTTITRRPAAVAPLARRYRPTVETLEERLVPTLGSPFFVGGLDGAVSEVRTASSANGSIVVWSDNGNGNYDVFAQRYDSLNNPVGGPFPIANTSSDEDQADVAMDAAGNRVVVWRVNSGGSGDFNIHYSTAVSLPGGGSGGSSGVVADSSFTGVHNPRVALNGAGIWTVTFEAVAFNGSDIFARRFDLFTSDQQGGDILVATSALTDESGPVIDGNTPGRFTIAYLQQTGTVKSLFVKRYSPAGKFLGKSKIVTANTASGSHLDRYDVAMDNAGNATVVYALATALTDEFDIYSRKVTKGGVLGGRKTLSNLAGDHLDPVIGMHRVTGQFVVAFSSFFFGDTIVQERAKNGSLIVEHPPIDIHSEIRPQSVSVDGDGTYLIGLLLATSGSGLDAWAAFGDLP